MYLNSKNYKMSNKKKNTSRVINNNARDCFVNENNAPWKPTKNPGVVRESEQERALWFAWVSLGFDGVSVPLESSPDGSWSVVRSVSLVRVEFLVREGFFVCVCLCSLMICLFVIVHSFILDCYFAGGVLGRSQTFHRSCVAVHSFLLVCLFVIAR